MRAWARSDVEELTGHVRRALPLEPIGSTPRERHVRPLSLLRRDWAVDAACAGRDTALWFSSDRFEQAVATFICKRCPVRHECLAAALAEEAGQAAVYGIRGGLTSSQRR